MISSFHVQPWCATKLKDEVTNEGNVASWAYCGPDCPMHPDAFTTDNTMKVTHKLDRKEKIIALKLLGILAVSLLLIGLMFTGLGNLIIQCKKY